MAKVKVTREDLKRDELRDFGADLMEWYQPRKNMIWIATAVILTVLILARVWGAYSQKKKIEAGAQYATALEAYQQALITSDPVERETQINQIQTMTVELRNKYPGTISARQSILLQGNALYLGNSSEKAIQLFKEYLETAGKADDRATALISLGYCYEDLFFRSDMKDSAMANSALQQFQRGAEEAQSPDLRRSALLGQARMFEVTGALQQAVEVYKRIVAMAEDSAKADEEKFLVAEEQENKKFPVLNPSDMHTSRSIAQQQIERLELLIQAGESIAAERSVPPASAPASGPATAPSATAPAASPATAPVLGGLAQ